MTSEIGHLLSGVFENVILAGFLWILAVSLGGRFIPPKYRKKVFVIILIILLMGMISPSLAGFLGKLFLFVVGGVLCFKFLCS